MDPLKQNFWIGMTFAFETEVNEPEEFKRIRRSYKGILGVLIKI